MQKNGEQTETVLTSDRLLGPYAIQKTGFKPLGMSAGDFDLALAPDGKGYYFFERVHSETIIADLTDDYCDVTGYYSTHFPHAGPPYVREATAHFMRNHKHYLLTSGTTGYFPNPSEAAVAETWHGPYRVLGDPHRGDESRTSFHSQISCVFRVQGTDLYPTPTRTIKKPLSAASFGASRPFPKRRSTFPTPPQTPRARATSGSPSASRGRSPSSNGTPNGR